MCGGTHDAIFRIGSLVGLEDRMRMLTSAPPSPTATASRCPQCGAAAADAKRALANDPDKLRRIEDMIKSLGLEG
jgi:hypothetical protein